MKFNQKHNLYVTKGGILYRSINGRLELCKTSNKVNGYITLSNDVTKYAHRIVWETFNGDIPKGYEIDHIDKDRSNNNLENLRLVTHKENLRRRRTWSWNPSSILSIKEKISKGIPLTSRDRNFMRDRNTGVRKVSKLVIDESIFLF